MFASHDLPDGIEASLDAEATFEPSNFSFPHGTHLCAMEVDTETGAVKIRNYTCVDDIGKVINPMIVEGQVHGGLVQGIAQALFEEAIYDDSGTLVTGSFVDYLVPSAADLPSFTTDRTETAATTNVLGRQGNRRGGHDRVDACGRQRHRRCAAPAGHQRHRHAVYAASGLDRDPERVEGRCDAGRQSDRGRQRLAVAQRSDQRWRCRMIPAAFDYVAPESVADALAALSSDAEEIKVIAGGQSLLPVLKLRLAAPTLLVDLGRIPGLAASPRTATRS